MTTLYEKIEAILKPAINTQAPYAKAMITELTLLIGTIELKEVHGSMTGRTSSARENGGFQDHAGNHVSKGERVVYRLDGVTTGRGVLLDALQDGDAYVDWDSPYRHLPAECKLNNLWREI